MKIGQHADWGIAIARVVVGAVFAAHGAQKLFTFGIGATTQGFSQAGIPLATIVAPAVALIEFLGGLALILGLGTRIAAGLLAMVMVGAIFFVHLRGGFFLPSGVEFALTLFATNVAFVLAGPGALAVDRMFHRTDRAERSTVQKAA
ncbi:MAG TPA: DoxX family protein [Terriglobales bacterium]|nr:DoxX family protein [Terriglobales bacterium]